MNRQRKELREAGVIKIGIRRMKGTGRNIDAKSRAQSGKSGEL